jgi:hypothetical protein
MGILSDPEQRQYRSLMAEYLSKAAIAYDAWLKRDQDPAGYAQAEGEAAKVWCQLRPLEAKIGKAWAHT